MAHYSIGIDLGTTNCALSHFDLTAEGPRNLRCLHVACSIDAMPLAARAPSLMERLGGQGDRLSAAARLRLAPLDRPLLVAWTAASILLLGALGRSAVQLHRRRRGWEPRVVDGETVLVAPDTGPAVIGVANISDHTFTVTIDGGAVEARNALMYVRVARRGEPPVAARASDLEVNLQVFGAVLF